MSSPYKLHIHRWATRIDANVLAIAMAQEIAVHADWFYDLMVWMRQGVVDARLPPRPDRDDWLRMYRDHRRLTVNLAGFLPGCGSASDGIALQAMLDESRAISTWSRNDPDEVRAWLEDVGKARLQRWFRFGYRTAHRLYKRHLREIQRQLIGEVEEDTDDLEETLTQRPEVYFYLRVVLPCVCLYRQPPIVLLRRAQRGDAEAIERLVRLDDVTATAPSVVAWWNGASGDTRTTRRDRLHTWAGQGLDHGRFDRGRFKRSLGALVSALVETIGMYWDFKRGKLVPGRVTAAQIQDLFNAVTIDRALRKHRGISDPDIGEMQPDSLRRQMSRDRKLWRVVIGGGSKFGRV